MKNNIPLEYIYLDDEGLNRLFNQITESLETERISINEKTKSGNLNLKAKIGKIFELLHLGDIAAGTEFKITGKEHTQVRTSLTTEHKINLLIKYFLENLIEENYYNNLINAMNNLDKCQNMVFINIRDKFNMPQFYPENDGVKMVNTARRVFFEKGKPLGENGYQYGDSYNYNDDYYKDLGERVIMNASLDKFTRSSTQMSYTGHDAVIFSGYKGHAVPLNVFGTLRLVNNSFYQIKPYAIWL